MPTDLQVELPIDQWHPISPPTDTPRPEAVQFVDGVRRIEGRVWITGDDEVTRLGICASFAAGAVRCTTRAELIDAEVRRTVVSTAGAPALDSGAGRFEPFAVADDSLERLVNGLQGQMGDLEVETAQRNRSDDTLVVLDGPLSRGRHQITGAVGYVKTHRVSYLPTNLSNVVSQLAPGERTPVFPDRDHMESDIRGICGYQVGRVIPGLVLCDVRCWQKGKCRESPRWLTRRPLSWPRYASAQHKEARAPQNLYPISGLERELRRRLGDETLHVARASEGSERMERRGGMKTAGREQRSIQRFRSRLMPPITPKGYAPRRTVWGNRPGAVVCDGGDFSLARIGVVKSQFQLKQSTGSSECVSPSWRAV